MCIRGVSCILRGEQWPEYALMDDGGRQFWILLRYDNFAEVYSAFARGGKPEMIELYTKLTKEPNA